MDYKNLFQKVIGLISSPAKTWSEIIVHEDKRIVMPTFVYPLIGLCGLSCFIGTFIGNTAGVSAFQLAMTRCCAVFVSLFGGYFLSTYLVDKIGRKWYGRNDSYEQNLQFVGYSMVVTFVLNIVSGLFSLAILHWLLQVYMLFIVFEGARYLLKVPENKLTSYTLIVSLVLFVCPEFIKLVFNKLSVVLN